MKTFVITLAKNYPAYHKMAGTPTHFKEKFLRGEKIHTIRGNYNLWKKRIDLVNQGQAVLSVREWSGKPYNSKQTVICDLKGPLGIQPCEVTKLTYSISIKIKGVFQPVELVSFNDGLTLINFKEWFKKPLTDGCVIHFRDDFY